MSKQSSIDWLYNTIDYEIVSYLDGEIDLNELSIAMLKIKEQAKAMHKDEIEGAYGHGQNNGYMYANLKAIPISKEDYFNRTFGDEEVL